MEERKRKRKAPKKASKEEFFVRKNFNDRINFGPYNGKTFIEVARKDINYLFLCIEWINDIKFFQDKLGLAISQNDCDLKEAHNIYNYNIKLFRDPKNYRETDLNREIIKNIKSENFDKQLHLSLHEVYKRKVEEYFDMSDNETNSKPSLLYLKLMISIFNEDASVINHIECQLSKKQPVEDISGVEISWFETFKLLIDYYRYKVDLEKKIRNEVTARDYDSIENYWKCDICDGNSTTGCQYFDRTECPRFS